MFIKSEIQQIYKNMHYYKIIKLIKINYDFGLRIGRYFLYKNYPNEIFYVRLHENDWRYSSTTEQRCKTVEDVHRTLT